jgi:hypothetical protein
MPRSPLVSVLLPVRDGGTHLAAALESLVAHRRSRTSRSSWSTTARPTTPPRSQTASRGRILALERLAGGVVLGAVAGEKARAEIREVVAAQGRRDGIDFVAVA